MTDIKQLLPTNNYQALVNANAPTALNPYATIADIGGNDKNFVFTQLAPLASWFVSHNLNKRCSVTVVDAAFNEIEAQVIWNNNNEVTVNFNSPMTGYVYCN